MHICILCISTTDVVPYASTTAYLLSRLLLVSPTILPNEPEVSLHGKFVRETIINCFSLAVPVERHLRKWKSVLGILPYPICRILGL